MLIVFLVMVIIFNVWQVVDIFHLKNQVRELNVQIEMLANEVSSSGFSEGSQNTIYVNGVSGLNRRLY